jgi:hypothetical protein
MRGGIPIFLAAAAWLLALPAAADPLDEAVAAGWIGEQADGYLGARPDAPPAARELVARINAERADLYGRIAVENGITPTAVAALAGQKLVERTPAGSWYRGVDWAWKQK